MNKTKKIISIILIIAWMLLIFTMSEMTGAESHSTSKGLIEDALKVTQAVSSNTVESTNTSNSLNFTNSDASNTLAQGKTNEITNSTNSAVDDIKTKEGLEKERQTKINKIVKKYEVKVRKFAHASEFFVLALLFINLIYQSKGKVKWQYLLVTILFCFLYACTDEFHQKFIVGRTSRFTDVLIDTCGALIAVVGVCIFKMRNLKVVFWKKKVN